MKTLHFEHGGKDYECSLDPETLGHVTKHGAAKFALPNPSWRILGVSKSPFAHGITVPLSPDVDPASLTDGMVWDVDHGTIRMWSGKYCGRLPRVRRSYVSGESSLEEALADLLEFSNGKLGGNPYLISEYKEGLRTLARAIGWKGDWMDTLKHYKGRKLSGQEAHR